MNDQPDQQAEPPAETQSATEWVTERLAGITTDPSYPPDLYLTEDDARILAVEVERLRARVAELEDELQRRHSEYAKALNRRCTVEDALYDVAAGKRDLLTREECRELAIKLGVPPAEPKTKKPTHE